MPFVEPISVVYAGAAAPKGVALVARALCRTAPRSTFARAKHKSLPAASPRLLQYSPHHDIAGDVDIP
jgi:hypothetical protein